MNTETLVIAATFVIPLVAGVAVARRVGGTGVIVAALLFPSALALVAWIAYGIWNPDRGCSEECWGSVIFFVLWLVASLGAELGLAGGALAQWVTARRRYARDPRASSP
jgi:H+/Cl- antiporter ClcA